MRTKGRLVTELIVAATLLAGLPGLAHVLAASPAGSNGGVSTLAAAGTSAVEPLQEPGPQTLAYEFTDFFNVPYGEWWDYRFVKYGDLPINAECFSAEAIANGVCTRVVDPAVPDMSSYPYTNWYPLPGQIRPGAPNNNPMLYAPYRFSVVGRNVTGYSASQPVFLPVLNEGAPPSGSLDFDWYMQYLDTASAAALQAAGCGRLSGQMDGFIIRSQITLTMDLAESKRIFGVPIDRTAADAQAWWDGNVLPGCLVYGALEDAVELWYTDMGNTKYDVVNSFEFAYTPFFTDISASVDASGITTVAIDHGAWATEVLLARMFYWGSAGYQANYLDSTKRTGWWGMELAWFEDFRFVGSLDPATMDFGLSSVMQYNFQQVALPGPNGIFDKTDDVPIWTWGPILSDYTNDYTPTHLLSELDRYVDDTYVHSTPGAPVTFYGQAQPYDVIPTSWDLVQGETWRFQFPTTPVVFYDPNLTPYGADPTKGQYVENRKPLGFDGISPAGFGSFNEATGVWQAAGPLSSGGLPGSPGPDGIAGTADDQYPLVPYPSIRFVPFTPPPVSTSADLVGRSAWPDHHHWPVSKYGADVVLNAKVTNLGNAPVTFVVVFSVFDGEGNLRTVESNPATLAVGGILVVSGTYFSAAPGKYLVMAQVMYDQNGDGTLDTLGSKIKSFSFTVVS